MIPILLLIFIIISLLTDNIRFREVSHHSKYINNFIENRAFFYEDSNPSNKYNYIKNILPKFAFVVDNENEENELRNFIEKETNIKSIDYYTISEKKNNINSDYTIYMIQKNGKYKITLKGRDLYEIIDLYYETQEETIDLFNVDSLRDSYWDEYSGIFNNDEYNTFLDLQSLLAKYLIYKKTRTDPDKNIILFTGTNPYPPFNDFNHEYNDIGIIGIIFSGIISFELSIATYFFNVRMIDEKEKKLAGFLERQGVSKKYYFFSWLFSYVTLYLFDLLMNKVSYNK